MFKLLRYFSLTSLVACTLTTISLSFFYRQNSLYVLIDYEEKKNIALTQSFANSLWQEFEPFITSTSKLSDEEIKTNPETAKLYGAVLNQMQGLSVVKVKIFDLEGRTIFSTETKQIGERKSDYKGFLDARAGNVTSKIDERHKFQAFDKIIENRSLISSYLPILSGTKIEGVLELYSDVTPAVQQIKQTQRTFVFEIVIILVALYFVLFLIVRHADRLLQKQSFARQLAEESLARKVEELARSNAELEKFAYIASHDLQEPLRKIESFGDRLKAKCASRLSPNEQEYLERMQNAAGRMRTLIQDLLALSRVTSGAQSFVPVDLNEVLKNVISDLEVRLQETGGRIEVSNLPKIEAEPVQMRQLFQNLIGNALKFRRQEEAIVIKIDSKILPPSPKEKNLSILRYQIAVADNGIGFEQKYSDRIFQIFQRLHGRNQYEGTGIGLAICAKIAERHGGSITAQSTLGQGSRFIITLLAAQNQLKEGSYDENWQTDRDFDCR